MLNEFLFSTMKIFSWFPTNVSSIAEGSKADTTVNLELITSNPQSFRLICERSWMRGSKLARGGYFYIMPVWWSRSDSFCQTHAWSSLIASISVGVRNTNTTLSQLRQMRLVHVISHGHADGVIRMIQHQKGCRYLCHCWKCWNSWSIRELENAGLMRLRSESALVRFITKVKTGFSTGGLAIGCSSLVLKSSS